MNGVEEGSPTLLVAITVAVAAVAVLAAIVVVAVGGGGELSTEHPDHPPLTLPGRRPAAGTDAALLRLPLGLWGYHKQITDEALERFAHELTERDTRIAVLEQELAEVRQRANGGALESPRRRALPAATSGDPLATRLDQGEVPLSLPAGRDPLVTRVDESESRPVLPAARVEEDGRPPLPSRREARREDSDASPDPEAASDGRTDDPDAEDAFAPPDERWTAIAEGGEKKDDDA